ncbi:MAG: hypothetical protein ACLFWM_13980 [Actinomycetota bacterium]
MRRKVAAAVLLLAVGAAVVSAWEGPARVAAWEVVMVGAVAVMAREAWPDRPRKAPPLLGGADDPLVRPLRLMSALELEVAGSADPRLSGERLLRSRLTRLLRHRAGLGPGPIPEEVGRRLLGQGAWHTLMGRDGPMSMDEIEELTDRIEAL